MFDGFYAVATNLDAEDNAKEIIRINSQRYRIEDCFRVLKTNFKARPVNHRRDDRIIAHFMTCYTALLIQRIIEVKLNRNGRHFTTDEIIENLKNMNVVNKHIHVCYQATYTSSAICDALNDTFRLHLPTRILSAQGSPSKNQKNFIRSFPYNNFKNEKNALKQVLFSLFYIPNCQKRGSEDTHC